MQYYSSSFNKSGISRLALGTMSFHDKATGKAVIHAALDAGINCFDTADLYDHGENERIVGDVLAKHRQEVIIATKVGNRWRADGSGWDWVPRKSYIIKAVEGSLRRLRTDYLDLYQLHGGTIDDPWDEVISAFEQLQADGKILAYGISSIRPNVIRNWIAKSKGNACMTQYSLLDRRPEEFSLPYLQEKGQCVLVRGALAKGLLAGKPSRPYLGHSASAVAAQYEALQTAAGSYAAGVAIEYCIQHLKLGSVVLGASTAAQIRAAAQAWGKIRLRKLNWSTITAAVPAKVYELHR